ncbi:hypothetical protein FRB93_002201 [Tulasnella sp. JGI-2019a]|nr:hypothetical protein FRB93_002201 [Tulasnella sp. JGI-2019a]
MADHAAQQESRKLKPIYDALDTGSYKLAIQNCNKLLKKQPQHETIRALKSLALLRSNKIEESIKLCDEVLAGKPTDESVLGVLSHVLKNLERTPDISTMFEEAYKKQPQNEELAVQTFMAMVRVGSWKTAQGVALRNYKNFKNTKYLFWSVMSAVLQAQNAGGPNPGFGDHTPMLLTLALRLLQSSPIPSHISPDYFWLHLTILKSLDKIEDAFELITSDKGRKLCETSLLVEELRRDIFKMKSAYGQEAAICSERLRKGDRNWTTFLSLIDATFMLVANREKGDSAEQSSTEASNGKDATESKAKTLDAPTGEADGDPELTPRATSQQSLAELEALNPEELISGLLDLLKKLAKEDGQKERGAHLAILHVEKKVRARVEALGETAPPTFMTLLRQYFTDFSDKACCFEDLKPYISALSPSGKSSLELEEWLQFLKEQVHEDRSSLADVQRTINVFKLQRFSLIGERSPEDEHSDTMKFLKVYFECLPVGQNLSDKDIQPADDLALLAVNALVSAWVSSRKDAYLHQALVILEYASLKSKYNYQFRVLAVRLYRLLGANAPAISHYHHLDIKLVQCDTLSHLVLSRGSTFSLAATGDIGMMQECIIASEIYTSNQNDTPDMLVKAFQHEKYSQITEFVEFEDRLDNSLQRDLTRIEYVRMKFITEKLETESLLQELQELEFVVEKMHHDNRDFSIIANYQPRGQLLADQTTMGVNRGFQWLTVFLQLYIRAYARACKVESTTSIDLSTFRTSWLSEMTEDEKEFLKFSQILHEWVPCPPLEPREPILTTADGTTEGNGDAKGEPKPALSPPHVSQEGTPLTVEASKETAIKYFEDAKARCEAALSEKRPLWEALHIATLAQEAFILIQIVSMPWVSGGGKGKKSADATFMQGLKAVRAAAATHIRGISTALTEYSESEGTADRRKEFVDNTAPLAEVSGALGHDYRLGVGATFTSARKASSGGIGQGMLKVVEGH